MVQADQKDDGFVSLPSSPEYIVKSLNDIHRRLSHIEERKGNKGGDGGGGDMEARVAVLEQIAKDTQETLKDIKSDISGIRSDMKSDFRWILGVGIAAFGSLAGLILKVLANLPPHP